MLLFLKMENEKHEDGHNYNSLPNLPPSNLGNNSFDYRKNTNFFLPQRRIEIVDAELKKRKSEQRVPKGLREVLLPCPLEILDQEKEFRYPIHNRAIEELLKEHYKDYLRNHPEEYLYSDLDEKIIEIVEQTYRNGQYAFITLNFNEAKFDVNKVLDVLNGKQFKYVNRWLACFEFHTKSGNHPHIHMIVEKKDGFPRCAKAKFITDYHRRFKDFLDDKQKVDVRFPKNPQQKLDYILGIKVDEKMSYVEEDKKKRQELGLLPTYGNWQLEK